MREVSERAIGKGRNSKVAVPTIAPIVAVIVVVPLLFAVARPLVLTGGVTVDPEQPGQKSLCLAH